MSGLELTSAAPSSALSPNRCLRVAQVRELWRWQIIAAACLATSGAKLRALSATMFTGGDPGIAQTLQRRYNEEPGYAAQFGLNPESFEYTAKA